MDDSIKEARIFEEGGGKHASPSSPVQTGPSRGGRGGGRGGRGRGGRQRSSGRSSTNRGIPNGSPNDDEGGVDIATTHNKASDSGNRVRAKRTNNNNNRGKQQPAAAADENSSGPTNKQQQQHNGKLSSEPSNTNEPRTGQGGRFIARSGGGRGRANNRKGRPAKVTTVIQEEEQDKIIYNTSSTNGGVVNQDESVVKNPAPAAKQRTTPSSHIKRTSRYTDNPHRRQCETVEAETTTTTTTSIHTTISNTNNNNNLTQLVALDSTASIEAILLQNALDLKNIEISDIPAAAAAAANTATNREAATTTRFEDLTSQLAQYAAERSDLVHVEISDIPTAATTTTANKATTTTRFEDLTSQMTQYAAERSPMAILKKNESSNNSTISILKRFDEKSTYEKDSLTIQQTCCVNESLLVEHIALTDDVVAADEIAEFVKPERPRKSSSRLKLDTDESMTTDFNNKNNNHEETNQSIPQDTTTVLTVTEALKALPAQEVSITTTTSVRRSASFVSPSPNNLSRSSSATNLNNNNNTILTSTTAATAKTTKKKIKGRAPPKKSKDSSEKANARAAMMFNRAVRDCVENSDPDSMRRILRDPANKNYALDATVLETVMKAYVMAAMFEDALYCLCKCALPGTLAPHQTERILTCLPQNLRNSSAFVAADMINALSIATEFDSAKKRTYFLRIVRGIALEFLEEATSARDRICSAPCERLIRSALCVVDAQFKRGKRPGELIAIPGSQLGVFLPEGNFMDNRGIQSGDAVSILPYSGPYPMSAESLDRNMIEATVAQTSPLVLKLQDKANASLLQMLTESSPENVYRVDKLANRMGFNRQLSAAVAIASTPSEAEKGLNMKDQRRPCPELIHAITAMDENIDRMLLGAANGNYNRSNMHSTTAAICSEAIPVWTREEGESQECIRDKSRLLLDKYNALDNLNNSQKMAIEGAVTNRLTLIQGPPGTGKTMVAIRILQYWARLASYYEDGSPILATSDSNIAVDNLVEGCANAGLRVIRLGRPEAVRPELLRYCIDRQGAPTSSSSSFTIESQEGPQSDGFSASSYKEKMKKMKAAQVICCTCIGSGADILDSMSFERVLVDEATQATEPAVLVPLTRGCRQLVLVGDHCQLPPTVLSTRAEEEGLGVPLFSRMVACGVPPFMLDTQYRMHPGIAMFPSDLFYGGKLLNGVSAPERRPLAGFPWPRMEFPVAFVPVNHGVEMDDGQSKYNEAEAAAACDAVAALLQGGQCTVTDIAVVTPYAAQVRLIRRLLRKLVQRPPYVEVSSVDGFQGREKEAVIFSAVRSNDYGAVGFVSDWRRVNVSFTRARRALIVMGNDHTLRRGDPDTWLPWLAWADAHGVNMDKPGVPRGRYDSEQLRRVRGGTTAAEMLKHVLERQQAQLKVAEQQLQKAERNAVGHIMGQSDEVQHAEVEEEGDPAALDTYEDLEKLANADGCWDDSDDEHIINVKAKTFSTPQAYRSKANSSSDDKGTIASDDEPSLVIEDAWDL